ncbi:MAG: HigA family addiction module antitoxin [Burkholderiales bacterium]|nr:HigA family addiction module antitoxin [Burkholderiales bacterium]
MSIRIEELSGMDFSDVATKKRIPPTHPGDILLHDFLEPLNMSANALATALHVPANRITGILNHTRGVSADTALRLARYFGNSPEFWLGLQADFDLRSAQAEIGRKLEREIAPYAAAA